MSLPASSQGDFLALFLALMSPVPQRAARGSDRPVWKWYSGSRGYLVAELGDWMLDRRKGDAHAFLFRLEGGEWSFRYAVHVQTDLGDCVKFVEGAYREPR